MTDTIIQGSGNSRSIKSVPNLAALAPTWEKALELLTGDGLPIDLGPLNPAGLNVRGTDLTKENLLKDATAALYGKNADATLDDILAAIRPLITTAQSTANGRARIQTGSYTGANANTKSLSFSFVPSLIVIGSNNIYDGNKNEVHMAILTGGSTRGLWLRFYMQNTTPGSSGLAVTWGSTVTWSSDINYPLNMSQFIYQYIAIG